MITKETIDQIKNQVIETIEENKKILIIGGSVLVITLLITLNIGLFQMTYYTMKEDTTKVISLMSRHVEKENRQDDFDFKKGMSYLLENLSEESTTFLEENFKYLTPKLQEAVLKVYNEKNLTFNQNQDIFHALTLSENYDVYSKYIKRLSITQLEQGLKIYFGKNPKLTQDVVDRLYKILSLQTQKLTLEDFKISVYELMKFPHNGDLSSTSLKLLDYIEQEAIRKSLFTELKTNPIEIEEFAMWVDILNRKKVIDTKEYATFTTSYGNIRRLQDQYKQMVMQGVDLLNVKQMIDVQTEEVSNKIVKLEKDKEGLEAQIQKNKELLKPLQNYKEIELYVLDQYENGDYEVAIPEKSWLFGNYKPGSQRMRLKVTRTIIESSGVKTFKVYDKGKSQEGLPYYEEVSNEVLSEIAALTETNQSLKASIEEKEKEINKYNQEIAQIRKTNNYDQTMLLIEEVERKKANIEIDIKKEKLIIQNLFQIGELIVETKK